MPFKRGTRYPLMGAPRSYINRVLATSPAAYWPLDDPVGSDSARNLIDASLVLYHNDAVFGAVGIGDGRPAASFTGDNTNIELGSAAFDAIWDGDYGSAITWQCVDAASRWTDSSTYRWVYHPRASDDATYYVCFGKNGTNHQLEWRRRAGGAIHSVQYTFPNGGPTGWFAMGMTWNHAATEIRCFVDGIYAGSSSNGWDTFGEHPMDSASTALYYAGSLTLQEWIGRGAHCIYWNSVLSDATMLNLTKF